jgi:hypothetical protein
MTALWISLFVQRVESSSRFKSSQSVTADTSLCGSACFNRMRICALFFSCSRMDWQPDMYLIPSMTWLASPLQAGFSSRDYGSGLKSEPEWGLQVTAKTRVLLEDFRFDRAVAQLTHS